MCAPSQQAHEPDLGGSTNCVRTCLVKFHIDRTVGATTNIIGIRGSWPGLARFAAAGFGRAPASGRHRCGNSALRPMGCHNGGKTSGGAAGSISADRPYCPSSAEIYRDEGRSLSEYCKKIPARFIAVVALRKSVIIKINVF